MFAQELRVSDLRRAFDRLSAALEKSHGATIDIPVDHYWHLWASEAFDLSRDPSDLTVGLVSDDLAELRSFAADPNEPDSLWHELHHVIGVLRALEHMDSPP